MNKATSWERKPALEGKHGGCLNCGPRPNQFPADAVIAVGFGYAGLHKDGQTVWSENDSDSEDWLTGAQAEAMAVLDPGHDWQIVLQGPLSGRTYQRHGPGNWALIEQDEGFA